MVDEEKKDIGAADPGELEKTKDDSLRDKADSDVRKRDKKPRTAEESEEKEVVSEEIETEEIALTTLEPESAEHVIRINRVSKVVKGGKNFSFSALVVNGDRKGQVGMGFGKSNEVVEAIKKASAKAKESFIKVSLRGDTIPHEIIGKFKSSTVIMKPAGPGTGVIAGGAVRAVCDAAGIKNILTKSLGSRNAINVVRATLNGLNNLRLKRRG